MRNLRRMIRLLSVVVACLLLCPPALAAQTERVLHIAPNGDDANPGTQDKPLRTIEAAQAILRSEQNAAARVWLHGGVYAPQEALAFTRRDSNTVYAAWPGDTPVLSGTVKVEDWAEQARGGQTVWVSARRPLGALWGEDGARQNARWPKEGTLRVVEARTSDAVNASSDIVARYRAFVADPSELPPSLDGAVLRMAHLWKDERTGVARVKEDGLVVLNRRTSMTVREGDVFWFENVSGAPLLPGEWAWDAATERLLYAPRAGETMENTPLYAAALETLVTIEGARNLRFEGIAFARTGFAIPLRDQESDFAQAAYDATACVTVRDAREIAFENCRFFDTGGGCIQLGARVVGASVRGCRFERVGAHAVYVKGRNLRDETEQTRDIFIEDNRIEGYGRVFYNAPAILVIHARQGRVADNAIRDGYYSGISLGWVWGDGYNVTDGWRIENNLIEDIGQGMLSDMGGIYLLGRQPNTVIQGNVVRRVTAREYGGWGIYLDEGADGVLVTQNLCHDCSDQGFFQHRGGYNRVQGNMLAFSAQGQVGMSDKTGHGTFLLTGNLIVGDAPHVYAKYGKETYEDAGDNLYLEQSPFADAGADDFTLLNAQASALIGWSPAAVLERLGAPNEPDTAFSF